MAMIYLNRDSKVDNPFQFQALKFLTSLHTVYGKKVVPADTKWALMGVQKRIDVDLPKKSEEAAFLKYLEYYTSA